MSVNLILLLLVTAAFAVLTGIALMDVGYMGIFEPNFQAWGAAQVFFDLVILAALSCIWMVKDARSNGRNPWPYVVLTFAAGAGLGYFLERWGTTRECWTYYTLQTPPLFAVLAHGMAAVAFWRTALLLKAVANRRFNKAAKLPLHKTH